MTHEQLVSLVRHSTRDVFGTMLGIELVDEDPSVGDGVPGPNAGVLALIGLAGSWAGSGTFSCSADMAQKISGQLLMMEFTAVDADVLDAIGEITNMVLGNVKTSLEEVLGPMGLSIPTVIYGRNFTTRSVGKSNWTVVPFQCLDERVEVHICLAPSNERQRSLSAKDHAAAVLTMAE
jgi:chemotaxis protein CheX